MILKFVRCISIPAKIIRYPGRWNVFSRARMEQFAPLRFGGFKATLESCMCIS